MNTQRVITEAGENTNHYTGIGYQYFLINDPAHGRTAKMQVAKKMLHDFGRAVGVVNGLGLQHLEILDQGNGWWLVCADQPQYDAVVVRFLARFNRWVLGRVNAKAEPTPEVSKRSRYTIEVQSVDNGAGRLHRPGQQLSSAQPTVVDEGTLQELADKVNARFGHLRSK